MKLTLNSRRQIRRKEFDTFIWLFSSSYVNYLCSQYIIYERNIIRSEWITERYKCTVNHVVCYVWIKNKEVENIRLFNMRGFILVPFQTMLRKTKIVIFIIKKKIIYLMRLRTQFYIRRQIKRVWSDCFFFEAEIEKQIFTLLAKVKVDTALRLCMVEFSPAASMVDRTAISRVEWQKICFHKLTQYSLDRC